MSSLLTSSWPARKWCPFGNDLTLRAIGRIGDAYCRTLYSALHPFINQTPHPNLRGAVDSLAALSGAAGWRPPRDEYPCVHDVICWGFPIAYSELRGRIPQLCRRLGEKLVGAGRPDASDLSESRAAALLVEMGMRCVSEVPRITSRKTPDYSASTQESTLVDVEVTGAAAKDEYIKAQERATALLDGFTGIELTHDLTFTFGECPTDQQIAELTWLGLSLAPGQEREVRSSWRISATKENRDPLNVWVPADSGDRLPEWWRDADYPLTKCVQHCGGTAYPFRVCVTIAIQLLRYDNPVRAKADKMQGSEERPFIVMVDVAHLPAAFERLPKDLTRCLPKWSHVSGVVLFELKYYGNAIGWEWMLVKNERAIRPLPPSISAKSPSGQRHSRQYPLVSQLETDGVHAINGDGHKPRAQ